MIINIKMIQASTGIGWDLSMPEKTILRDVFSLLMKKKLLTEIHGCLDYFAENMTQDMRSLDNDKSMKENGVKDNDTLLITIGLPLISTYPKHRIERRKRP